MKARDGITLTATRPALTRAAMHMGKALAIAGISTLILLAGCATAAALPIDLAPDRPSVLFFYADN